MHTIVKAPELRDFLGRLREKIWGGLEDAVNVVLENITQDRDAKMAFELLKHVGLLPALVGQIAAESQPVQPVPSEKQLVIDQMVKMAAIAYEASRVYGGDSGFEQLDAHKNQGQTNPVSGEDS